ncbi:radical SAM protein [Methanococcoides orientis]|uniref:4Fe-4S single cluster domain-containing protein n=1 Tax=Methanococcoides orientis TaxID=2822137 RepID=UPI001E62F634|nr:4Fe-4S single cluster domain-containing protein [Methanococcoides orientis]UGV41777.1 radical SAM protein [Methanococcoides orientis]
MRDYGTCFNVAHIEYGSQIYGPGNRLVVWFQGCSLACSGCWNKSMWSFESCKLIERKHLFDSIQDHSEFDGVTFLGGEPLDQIQNLSWLITELNRNDISIMLYTGYEVEEIRGDTSKSDICEMVDILVTGRYREEERDIFLRWRGSQNQKLIIKNNKSPNLDFADGTNQVEIVIDEYGSTSIFGYPDDEICPTL